MSKNWRTTVLGILGAVAQACAVAFPHYNAALQTLAGLLVGGGLAAAADAPTKAAAGNSTGNVTAPGVKQQ